MLTPFGKEVRKLRLEREMRLMDMANSLNRSSAYLSAVETGRKPLPSGFEKEVARVINASNDELRRLVKAADQSRKSVGTSSLSKEKRQVVAEFARRIQDTDDHRVSEIDWDAELKKLLKSANGSQPFKRQRGALVAPQSYASLWNTAGKVRDILGVSDKTNVPIMELLEFVLPEVISDFFIDVCDPRDIDGDEARAIPSNNQILFREDVYEAACVDHGRARFTAAHELGHYVLHNQVSFARSSAGQPIYRDAEWQADVFAGALLMPPKCFSGSQELPRIAEACGVTTSAASHMQRLYKNKGVS